MVSDQLHQLVRCRTMEASMRDDISLGIVRFPCSAKLDDRITDRSLSAS